ncbi:MAG: TMEM14 family protein [Cyanobacteria bacterium TGS_CYA1]|nr:TMEM14 family protein [Cyanobacteria bacterium TGS_CYA1]
MDLNFIANTLCAVSVVQVILVLHAILLAAGGIMGFVKAQSKPSLIAGVASAAILLVCLGVSFLAPTTAELIAFVVSDILVAVFAMRLKKTKKFMPSGMMLFVCLFLGTYYLVAAVTPWIITRHQGANSSQAQSI